MDTSITGNAAVMPAELALLGWSAVLALVMLAIHARTALPGTGLRTAAGSRDGNPQPTGLLAGRARRTWMNFVETYALSVVPTLGLVPSGQTGGIGLWARSFGSGRESSMRRSIMPAFPGCGPSSSSARSSG